MNAPRNLYDVLNVSHDAEPVVIEAAYRALMKKYHPDQGAPAAAEAPSAVDINRAFSILRDPERRTQYDHHEWARQQKMHLAQYQPPPAPRAPRAFGWAGWIVALILAGILFFVVRNEGPLVPTDTAAASLATPARADTRSKLEERVLPSFLKSNAAEREVELMRRAANVSSRASLVEAEARAAFEGPVHTVSPPRHPKARMRRRHRDSRGVAHEPDFLERQGYIY